MLGGQGLMIHSPIMPQSWAYNADVEQYAYDPKRAEALLDRAGWVLPETDQVILSARAKSVSHYRGGQHLSRFPFLNFFVGYEGWK